MDGKTIGKSGKDAGAPTRDERLKAALRANLQRRKAQARARDAEAPDRDEEEKQG